MVEHTALLEISCSGSIIANSESTLQEVKRIDNSVVVHALELAIKRDLYGRL